MGVGDEILKFGNFFNIQPPESVFLVVYLMLGGLMLLCKGDFYHIGCLYKDGISGGVSYCETVNIM